MYHSTSSSRKLVFQKAFELFQTNLESKVHLSMHLHLKPINHWFYIILSGWQYFSCSWHGQWICRLPDSKCRASVLFLLELLVLHLGGPTRELDSVRDLWPVLLPLMMASQWIWIHTLRLALWYRLRILGPNASKWNAFRLYLRALSGALKIYYMIFINQRGGLSMPQF